MFSSPDSGLIISKHPPVVCRLSIFSSDFFSEIARPILLIFGIWKPICFLQLDKKIQSKKNTGCYDNL